MIAGGYSAVIFDLDGTLLDHYDYSYQPALSALARLERAAEIGQEAGLHYVYAGNLPGRLAEYEHTNCHHCGFRLVERYGYIIMDYRLTAQGTCPQCGTQIPGIWTDDLSTVRIGGPGMPRRLGF